MRKLTDKEVKNFLIASSFYNEGRCRGDRGAKYGLRVLIVLVAISLSWIAMEVVAYAQG